MTCRGVLMGVDDLQDALDRDNRDHYYKPEYWKRIVEAARLVANGKRIRWCTQHQAPAGSEAEECIVKDEWGRRHDCVLVDAVVITVEAGEEE